jgi:hypothetical protein
VGACDCDAVSEDESVIVLVSDGVVEGKMELDCVCVEIWLGDCDGVAGWLRVRDSDWLGVEIWLGDCDAVAGWLRVRDCDWLAVLVRLRVACWLRLEDWV